MARIEGPDGRVVEVDAKGRLSTVSATQTLAQQLAFAGNAFALNFTQTPAGADDLFLYIKNMGLRDLGVGLFSFSATIATRITVEPVTGTPAFVTNGGAGTEEPTVNLNLGSTNIVNADFISDTDITGISSLGVMGFEDIIPANGRHELQINPGFVIPQGKAVALRSSVSSVITCLVTIGIIVDES